MRRRVSSALGLLALAALVVGVLAGPALAKPHYTAKQKAHIRAQLHRAIKKNPKLINKASFIKKASLVNFTLPVTVRLRQSDQSSNPNSASIDLGASLGQRTINLGGTLPAQIRFHDAYDGGALGNVDLKLIRSTAPGSGLTSTSIPLLWNSDVSGTPYTDVSGKGCGGYNGASPIGALPVAGGAFPFPVVPGVDSIGALTNSGAVGSPNNLGASSNPFPAGSGSPIGAPSVTDTVLRTGPLTLHIADPATVPTSGAPADGAGPQGTQSITSGQSGGQANLFGNIPGKSNGIDVTVNLETQINSILREVDPDAQTLTDGQPWPAYAFRCRQAWTGQVQNYLTGIHLVGSLKISPAIMPDGKLRIAKATLNSPANDSTQVALGACLMPYNTFAANANSSQNTHLTINGNEAANFPSSAPINPGGVNSAPAVPCNSTPVTLLQDALVAPFSPAGTGNGDGFTGDGSQVSVSGLLNVANVSADVLIGG